MTSTIHEDKEEERNLNETNESEVELTERSNDDSLLQRENENLRSQLEQLHVELSRLRKEQKQSNLTRQRSRKGSSNSWNWLNSFQFSPQSQEPDEEHRPVMVDDSFENETIDEEEEEVPTSVGLHHRRTQSPSQSPSFRPLESPRDSPPPMSTSLKSKDSDLEFQQLTAHHDVEGDEESDLSDSDGLILEGGVMNDGSFGAVLKDRAMWLVGLLVLQSFSSFIIKNHQQMLSEHIVIVRFLTMLVGAGGNAGNQASVRVIRGLAVGTLNRDTVRSYLDEEMRMGLCLSAILGVAGLVRAAIFMIPLAETVAITCCLIMIVAISIVIGALLPLGMKYVNIDPAHSSTTIQVLMDILGVTITVYISAAILDGPFGVLLGAKQHG